MTQVPLKLGFDQIRTMTCVSSGFRLAIGFLRKDWEVGIFFLVGSIVLYKAVIIFEAVKRSSNKRCIRKQEKCLGTNSVTQPPCCTKDESHPLFHQSVTQLTTVELVFDQIRTMTCVPSGYRCSMLFLALFVASQTLAKPGNSANSTPVSFTATKHCNNVYNSFYAGPNKKIETILHEMKKQLNHVEDEIIKRNTTLVKGKYRSV